MQKRTELDILLNYIFTHQPFFSGVAAGADIIKPPVISLYHTSLIYDNSVATQNLVFLSYWYRKKRL
jgi:hypothetical protein